MRRDHPPIGMAVPARPGARRILLIDAEGNAFNNPTLKCVIDLLLENGCRIDLRYPSSPAPVPQLAGVRLLPFGPLIRKLKTAIFSRLCSWSLATLSVMMENLLLYGKYDLVVGVDRQGLIEAAILKRLTGAPFVFLSFEIMFESETSLRYKALERRASKAASLWVVQDEVRAARLQAENGLTPQNRLLLPLASAGPGSVRTARLRDALRVPPDKRVAILIGSVAGWSMAARILKTVSGWPENWVLVIHERYGRTREGLGADLAQVQPLLDRRIFISDATREMVDDLGAVLAGASVGLAFYQPDYNAGFHTGKNLVFLGLASGKISTYLRYGVPVILNEVGLYADEARRHGFGRVVATPEEIRENLEPCLDERYRRNALGYFSEKLDFNNHREQVWARFSSLMATTEKLANA